MCMCWKVWNLFWTQMLIIFKNTWLTKLNEMICVQIFLWKNKMWRNVQMFTKIRILTALYRAFCSYYWKHFYHPPLPHFRTIIHGNFCYSDFISYLFGFPFNSIDVRIEYEFLNFHIRFEVIAMLLNSELNSPWRIKSCGFVFHMHIRNFDFKT